MTYKPTHCDGMFSIENSYEVIELCKEPIENMFIFVDSIRGCIIVMYYCNECSVEIRERKQSLPAYIQHTIYDEPFVEQNTLLAIIKAVLNTKNILQQKPKYEEWPPEFCTSCFIAQDPNYIEPVYRAIVLSTDNDAIWIDYVCEDCANDLRADGHELSLVKIEDCEYQTYPAIKAFVQKLDGDNKTTLSNRSKIKDRK